jgi:hypothetical protein
MIYIICFSLIIFLKGYNLFFIIYLFFVNLDDLIDLQGYFIKNFVYIL